MGYAIPLDIYTRLEEKLGKESAEVITSALETTIKEAIREGRESLKYEVSEELKKELASKYDVALVKKDIDVVRKEIDVVRKEINVVRKEIEMVRLEFKKDLRITTIILLAAIVFLNQNSLEFIARILGLLK